YAAIPAVFRGSNYPGFPAASHSANRKPGKKHLSFGGCSSTTGRSIKIKSAFSWRSPFLLQPVGIAPDGFYMSPFTVHPVALPAVGTIGIALNGQQPVAL